MNGTEAIRILVVDDDPTLLTLLVEEFRYLGLEAHGAGSVTEGLDLVQRKKPHIIITDLAMPDGGGESLLIRLKTVQDPPLCRFLTSGDIRLNNQAYELMEVDRLIPKPYQPEQVVKLAVEVLTEKGFPERALLALSG